MKKIFKSTCPPPPPSRSETWAKFTEDEALLAKHHVTADELVMLKSMMLLGSLQNVRDFISVLNALRFSRRPR
jgi:hypothetical protein